MKGSKKGKIEDKENAKPTGHGGKKSKKEDAKRETKKGDHWTPEEITCLVNVIYGPDNEYIFNMTKVHPTKAFKLVSIYIPTIINHHHLQNFQ